MTVDKDQIRKFIDAKVREAREWCAEHPEECRDIDIHGGSDSSALLWAVAITLLVYFALFYTKPAFVTRTDELTMEVSLDMTRAWMFAIVAGIICYIMLMK